LSACSPIALGEVGPTRVSCSLSHWPSYLRISHQDPSSPHPRLTQAHGT